MQDSQFEQNTHDKPELEHCNAVHLREACQFEPAFVRLRGSLLMPCIVRLELIRPRIDEIDASAV